MRRCGERSAGWAVLARPALGLSSLSVWRVAAPGASAVGVCSESVADSSRLWLWRESLGLERVPG